MTTIANVKQCYATLKNIESQLSSLALNSQEPLAQKTFHDMMLIIANMGEEIHQRTKEMEIEEPQYKES